MHKKRHTYSAFARVLYAAIIALLAFGVLGGSSIALAAPGQPPTPAAKPPAVATAPRLPVTTCTSPAPGARVCELWAIAGTLTLPDGVSVPILGYTDAVTGTAQTPGPALVVNEGETITITLHNGLAAQDTSLSFPAIDMAPDMVGAAPGGTAVYTFVASAPGTYLYEAGITANGPRQVAQGLYGALVVRSLTPGQAYDDPATLYDEEDLVILGEIDPALNNNPDTFVMQYYRPKYWLINGLAYPNTVPVETVAGHRVLLRYINAGLAEHSMALLGINQRVIANGAMPESVPYTTTLEYITPGEVIDAIVTIPPTAPNDAKYLLYDTTHHLHNGNYAPTGSLALGGMLTYLHVGGTPPGGDTVGPKAGALDAAPNPTNGSVDVVLTAMIDDSTTGNANVAAAEYFIDAPGANGTGTAMSGVFGTPIVAVDATISAATLAGLASGDHLLYVHGQDANGNWGAPAAVVLNLDKLGPAISGLSLTPNPTNGSAGVILRATANEALTGNGLIMAAEYYIDSTAGTPVAFTIGTPDTLVALQTTLSAGTLSGLSEGAHTFYVRAQDELGNWSAAFGTIDLLLDRTGPTASGVTAAPNPTNGLVGYNPNVQAVRVTAALIDPLVAGARSNLVRAEGFIDTLGAPGTGFAFIAMDGFYNSPSEAIYTNIPLATIRRLADGLHTIYVRGKDVSGNWGAAGTTLLRVDKTGPVVSGLTATPNPVGPPTFTTVLAGTATDAAGSIIAAAEWYRGTDPGKGFGTPMTAADGTFNSATEGIRATIDATGWTPGTYQLYVRAKDSVGNWGNTVTVNLVVTLVDLIFEDGFETGNVSAWSLSSGGANLQVSTTGALVGTYSLRATFVGAQPSFVADNTPANESTYRARFYFNPNGATTTGIQHDILVGRTTGGAGVFTVQYRLSAGALYQVRLGVARAGGTTFTSWFNITNGVGTPIEISWQSAASATIQLYVGGTLRQTLTGLNTSAFLVDQVRLGPQSVAAGMSGTEIFDAFKSTRFTYIGP